MVFYKINTPCTVSEQAEKEITIREKRARACNLAEKTENLYQKSLGQSMVITVYMGEDGSTFAVVAKTHDMVKDQFEKYKKMLPFEIDSYTLEEITFSSFEDLISSASRNCYIHDSDEVLKKFEIQDLNSHFGSCDFGESMIDETLGFDECKKTATRYLFQSTMHPELERIAESRLHIKCVGHPVHYLLATDDRDIRKTVYKALLSALYNSGRIKNKRYSFVDYNGDSRFPDAGFEALYRASEGGALVIRYLDGDEKESQFARRSSDIIAALCEIATKYKNKVLTIICLPQNSNKVKEEFMLNWGSTAFIELYEDVAFDSMAENYLKEKAKEYKIRSDKKLISALENNKGYTATELNRIFDVWYSAKLKNEIYPEYKVAKSAKTKIKTEEPKGNAYERLQGLIGLENAKSVMHNALNYFKAQKLFADRGIVPDRPAMHMVFTGNPGTAKTTVARLFAEIMKENGLLENGDMYEVGRADLVGKYVGSTAPLVKSAFQRAKGGVLFIDEAYALVDDRDGLYGDEAINTIVQEMENNRKDTVVIFAGYPDKMEGFLNKNPGLRSRIAFHIPFDDYSTEELCQISQHIAKEKQLDFSDDAIIRLENVFDTARESSDFGNGRYVRNIIEKAKMSQANRLMQMDIERITDSDLKTIIAEDIEMPQEKHKETKIKIGF